MFNRTTEHLNWSRFFYIAKRVKCINTYFTPYRAQEEWDYAFHATVRETIAKEKPRSTLFPKLVTLHWLCHGDATDSFSLVSQLIGPKLDFLRFHLPVDTHITSVIPLLRKIPLKSPYISSLDIRSRDRSNKTLDAIADLIRSLPYLEEIWFFPEFFLPPVISALADHPHLLHLDVGQTWGEHDDELEREDRTDTLARGSFPSLRFLSLNMSSMCKGASILVLGSYKL